MKVTLAKLGILAAIATALVLFATMRPGVHTPVAEADLGSPGGISALPSAAPAFPGIVNQDIPGIMPARGDGANGLVTVFCDPIATLPFASGPCNGGTDTDGDTFPELAEGDTVGGVTFEMTQLSGDGSRASEFDATGSDSVVCIDGSACDLAGVAGDPDNVISVLVKGGGENEILEITATDNAGEVRTVQMVVVDTILAWGETGAISTAAQDEPAFVSYACSSVGTRALTALDVSGDFDTDGKAGLDDIFDLLYGSGMGLSILANKLGAFATPDVDIPLLQCGGNSSSAFDDFVDFQTDKGLFSVDPAGVAIKENIFSLLVAYGIFTPPSLDFNCGEGKNIDTFDINSLAVWAALFLPPTLSHVEGGCDVDFAGNGVVTTMLLGNGEVGVATITAQQGGGASPVRTINVTFVGESALSLFITAPASIGLTGGDFTVAVVDQDGRPVGGETVQCTVDPTGGAMAILNQTGTTAAVDSDTPGEVTFTLVPTGASVVAGEKLTITCVLDRERSISATAEVTLSTTPELESVALVEGCNPIAATWADGTAIATVAGAVAPAEALDAIWKFDPATGTWMGFSPSAPAAVSDLASVDRLDAIFVCVNAAATIGRPVI